MGCAVYTVWQTTTAGATCSAMVVSPGESPPAGRVVRRLPETAPPAGESVVCLLADGLPEAIADDLARAYVTTMRESAQAAGVVVHCDDIPPHRPSVAALALRHWTLRYTRKRRNADLRASGYDPDGADGKFYRLCFFALLSAGGGSDA